MARINLVVGVVHLLVTCHRADLLDYAQARERMVRHQLVARGMIEPRLVAAFRDVDRHRFAPAGLSPREVYADVKLTLGGGQWIEEPAVLGGLLNALKVSEGCRVLEVGTGSGYAAAVLAAMGAVVTTVECDPTLARQAEVRLRDLAQRRESAGEASASGQVVQWHQGDGRCGWPGAGPYDRILLSGGVAAVEPAWLNQLRPQGFVIVPLGAPVDQRLVQVRADHPAGPRVESLGRCRFEMLT